MKGRFEGLTDVQWQMTHLLVDGNGSPITFESTAANGDEHQQIVPLLDKVRQTIERARKQLDEWPILEADKGYDAEHLRDKLLMRKIFLRFVDVRNPHKTLKKLYRLSNESDGKWREHNILASEKI